MKKNPDPFDTTPVIYITNPYKKDESKVIITHGKENRRERRKADRKRNK